MNNYDQRFTDLQNKIENLENKVNEIIILLKRNENEVKKDDKNGKD